MSTSLYILDLDRSALDTGRFATDVTEILSQMYGINSKQFHAKLMDSYVGEMGPDFLALAATATGHTAGSIAQSLIHELANTDYTYPDVEPWLRIRKEQDEPVIVVTVGHEDFQSLKFHCAKPLHGLPKVIINEDKGKVLREILAGERPDILGVTTELHDSITIIDDNPRTFEELGEQPNIRQFYLSRPQGKYAGFEIPAHVATITSLGEI